MPDLLQLKQSLHNSHRPFSILADRFKALRSMLPVLRRQTPPVTEQTKYVYMLGAREVLTQILGGPDDAMDLTEKVDRMEAEVKSYFDTHTISTDL